VDEILKAMEWLGLSWDEGPYYQSQRTDLYKDKVLQLLEGGKAYRCYCTPEELEQKRNQAMAEGKKPKYDGTCRDRREHPDNIPFVVRFLSPDAGVTSFHDLIKGTISVSNEELDDVIIQRSDGTPTYNFVVVVDDADMGITHVIRGDDHVNNTPRQVLMCKALGHEVPAFAHVPMILGSDKTRLSKRHGATSVMAYRDMGYLPEAMVNYLVRLGWSFGDEEIFSMEELVEKFSLGNVGKSAGVFNPEKLLWLNSHYIRSGDPSSLAPLLIDQINKKGLKVTQSQILPELIRLYGERAKTLTEMADAMAWVFMKEPDFDEKAVDKFLREEDRELFLTIIDHLEKCDPFTHDEIEKAVEDIMDKAGLKMGKVAQPIRVAMTGGTVSPSVFELLPLIGREETVRRLKNALTMLK
jgi:glutamyl-tRNA synthetase